MDRATERTERTRVRESRDARQPLRRFVYCEVLRRYLLSCLRSIGSFTNAGTSPRPVPCLSMHVNSSGQHVSVFACV